MANNSVLLQEAGVYSRPSIY